MSTDLYAGGLTEPFSLASLMTRGSRVTGDLLGGAVGPKLQPWLRRRFHLGQIVDPGHVATPAELDSLRFGPAAPPTGPVARLARLVGRQQPSEWVHLLDGAGWPVMDAWQSSGRMVFSLQGVNPDVGVARYVHGVAFCVAAALEGGGTLDLWEIGIVNADLTDPSRFVEVTKLTSAADSFESACRTYLRRLIAEHGDPQTIPQGLLD